MNIYWGDIHNHCGMTYGFGSLENGILRAKSQLDFAAFTGHAMWPDMYEKRPETEFVVGFHEKGFQKLRDHWEEIRGKIAQANGKELVTFQGYELHSRQYGDYHLLSKQDDLPLVYRDSPGELVEACGRESTIAIPHHIGYTPGYRGISWDLFDSGISPVVEVYSKHGCGMDEDADYPYYHNMGPRDMGNLVSTGLKRGLRFGFVGSTDHHAGFPGSYGDGLAAVLAEEKTRDSIWSGIKKRRTYAVTGDRIMCDFRINDALMGSEINGSRRHISYGVETEYPLDKIIVYKNGRPLHIRNGEGSQSAPGNGRYKIRLEMGWGNQKLYIWNGSVKTEGGRISSYRTYFRGRSVLAPSQEESYDSDGINDIPTDVRREDDCSLSWRLGTVGNKSTLHPSTSQLVIEVEGGPDTAITFTLNHKSVTVVIGELLVSGYTDHMEYYHSQAFKIYRAYPSEESEYQLELDDDQPEKDCDVYHLEVSQKNRQWAYVSPVFVNAQA